MFSMVRVVGLPNEYIEIVKSILFFTDNSAGSLTFVFRFVFFSSCLCVWDLESCFQSVFGSLFEVCKKHMIFLLN